MTNALVLQNFTRVSLLGLDIDMHTNIADEPVIEAKDLGRLLEYKDSRKCRDLVRNLVSAGKIVPYGGSFGTPQNSAEIDVSVRPNHDRPKVYAVNTIETHGVRPGTTEQLWMPVETCVLVATASETAKAWEVSVALVRFFFTYNDRSNPRGLSSAVAREVLAARDEMRALRADIVQQLDIDARVRKLEARRERTPPPLRASPRDSEVLAAMEKAFELSGKERLRSKEAFAMNPELARFAASPTKLSYALRSLRGVVVDGKRLMCEKDRDDVALWFVIMAD